MTVTVKGKDTIVIPPSIRKRLGIKSGDKLEIAASGNVMTIGPKLENDDEYTPETRRAILADAKAGLKEIEEGKFCGPFKSGVELGKFVEREIKRAQTHR